MKYSYSTFCVRKGSTNVPESTKKDYASAYPRVKNNSTFQLPMHFLKSTYMVLQRRKLLKNIDGQFDIQYSKYTYISNSFVPIN
jgi:hypothetical protein